VKYGIKQQRGFARFEEDIQMKKAMLLAVALLLVASSAFGLGPKAYIGIYGDAAHSACRVDPAPYSPVPAYIYILPSDKGMQAAEFAVSFPATVITLSSIKNPGITVELGAMTTGISVAFGEGQCQMDWVWLYNMSLMSLGTVPGAVAIIPHPGTLTLPAYQYATCELGYPIEPLVKLSSLHFYQPCMVGTQETNWGAIKSLF